jgi:peroxiredoxin
MTERERAEGPDIYAAFWVVKLASHGHRLDERSKLAKELQDAFTAQSGVVLRACYSLMGLRSDADALFWVYGEDLDLLQQTWLAVRATTIGRALQPVNSYIGLATPSRYVTDHIPAFVRGIPAKRYLSVYPFVKTHAWYLLPFEERQRLMREHGELGRQYPNILTNTISSFGLGDQEFIVAIESDDPGEIVRMMEHLRGARVRLYTAWDTPIYLGRRVELDVLAGQLAAQMR